MAFRKLVGSYKDYDLSTHVIEDGYLAVDVDTGYKNSFNERTKTYRVG